MTLLFHTILLQPGMNRRSGPYNIFHLISSVFMILALLWLTVSIPFVYKAQKQQTAVTQNNSNSNEQQRDDNGNPIANTTDEKVPIIPTEEYLHHENEPANNRINILRHYKDHTVPVYAAFHGELISPPPKA